MEKSNSLSEKYKNAANRMQAWSEGTNAVKNGQNIKNTIGSTPLSVSSIEDLGKQANILQRDPQGANKVLVVTKDDNLVHDYFHYFECWWDANNCLSGVLLKMPKTEQENTNYWINYVGDIIVYMGNSINSETVTNQGDKDGTYWDLQGLYPFFVGSTSRIKEKQNELEIYIDSVGRRFKSKIPDEFRQAFINNQNVRDAFQAICEFLGVYYICPPHVATEDEEEKKKSTDKDGTENDAGKKTKKEGELVTKAKQKVKSKKTKSKKSSKSNSTKSTNTKNSTNNSTDNKDDKNKEEDSVEGLDSGTTDVQMNGFDDISFDASGAIVHGQAVIETSPDMAKTLLALTEHPLHGNYDEKGNEYILEDVEKFLNGEIFESIHNNVMDYGAITIEPKAAKSTNMSTTGATNTNTNTNNNNNNNNNKNNKNKSSGTTEKIVNKDGSVTYIQR